MRESQVIIGAIILLFSLNYARENIADLIGIWAFQTLIRRIILGIVGVIIGALIIKSGLKADNVE